MSLGISREELIRRYSRHPVGQRARPFHDEEARELIQYRDQLLRELRETERRLGQLGVETDRTA